MLRRSRASAVSWIASRAWQPSPPTGVYSSWRRCQSNASSKSFHASDKAGHFWTTSRAFLFSAFASSLAYVYGVTDAGSRVNEIWGKDKAPQYGSAKELEKVCCFDSRPKFAHMYPNRPLLSFDVLWEMMRSVRTTKT